MLRHNVDIVGMTDQAVCHSIYIRDPDGHEIEIFVDMPDTHWRADPSLRAREMRPLSPLTNQLDRRTAELRRTARAWS